MTWLDLRLTQKELPDYLPMYLEFLSHQATINHDEMQIREEIANISHIVTFIGGSLNG